MTIGKLAEAASVNIQTVRYYERRGLIPEPARTASGYRQYAPDAIVRIRFIKRAQDLGFSLREIEDLLALRVHKDAACEAVEQKARTKIAVVDQKISELRALRGVLVELAAACETRQPTGDCPILEALDTPGAA